MSYECRAFLLVLYNEYRSRRKKGFTYSDSLYFGDDKTIKRDLLPNAYIDDIRSFCWVLADEECLEVQPGNDGANDVTLTDHGLSVAESIFPDCFAKSVDLLSKLSALIQWL